MADTELEQKKRQARRHLAPGQTTFVSHRGSVYPVYRSQKKQGEREVS